MTRYKLKLPAGWKVAGEDKADALVQLDSAPVADGEAGGVMMIAPSDNAIWKDHNDPKDATDLVEKAGKSPWILGTLPIVVMDSTGELPDGFFEKGHNIVDKKEPRVLIAVRKKPSAKSLYCVAMQLPDDATRDAALEICKSAQF